jgi:hypothetical protein
MNTEQAYINGFVKRATQYGYSQHEALNILKAAAELKGKQHKLDVDKDGKIEASDLKKLRQLKQAGALSEGYENAKQMVGNIYDSGKQLVNNVGDTYNSYLARKNTPTSEDLAANEKARSAYVQQMPPQPAHQKLTPTLAGGTAGATPFKLPSNTGALTGGTATAVPTRSAGAAAVRPALPARIAP